MNATGRPFRWLLRARGNIGSSVTRGKRRGGNKENKREREEGRRGAGGRGRASGTYLSPARPPMSGARGWPLVPGARWCPSVAAVRCLQQCRGRSGPGCRTPSLREPRGERGLCSSSRKLPRLFPPRRLSGEGDFDFAPVARGWGGRWVACLFFSFFSSPSLFSFCLSPSARAAAGLGAEPWANLIAA